MTDQPEQTAKDAEAESGDSHDHPEAAQGRTHEPDSPRMTDQRQFSDFALI